MPGVGTAFAGYRIQGVLGQGGMGTVYLAQHPRLPRSVALKLLNREVSTDPDMTRRFEREADVIARLEHPGIVGVLDRGSDNGHLWIAMPYVRGTDAASWDGAAHPPATVAHLLAVVASALDYAHSHGILHRDVKPANILIAQADEFRESHAMLTDFGIAGLIDSTETKITATGTFTATLAYASPEQLSGEAVGPRSDQYSLACTLFALLAGRPPYASTNPGQVVMGHLSKPVPRLTSLRPDLPAALDAVLERAMSKQPDNRFPSCTEFIAAARHTLEAVHVAETVNYARTAPTVHNSAPLGYGAGAETGPARSRPARGPAGPALGPMPNMPPLPRPNRVDPLGRRHQSFRSKFPTAPAVIICLVVALIGIGVVAQQVRSAAGPESTAGDVPSGPPWGALQYMKDDFPDLVPEQERRIYDLPEGKRVRCHISATSGDEEISCSHYLAGNGLIKFVIKDFANLTAVQSYLDSDRFRDKEIVNGSEIVHTAETIPAPNPALVAPAHMTVPPGGSLASIGYEAYFSFPADPDHGRYLIMVSWFEHSADDILRNWWSRAPLGK